MLENFWLKLSVDGAVAFVMDLVRMGFEGKHLAQENRALVREARTLWARKTRLENALKGYHTFERAIWIPSVRAGMSKPVTEETIRRRMRKSSGLTGEFKTGEPSPRIAESAIKRHRSRILSSESRNRALTEIIQVLRAHNIELAQSIDRWDRLEDVYSAQLGELEGISMLAMKRRMRKNIRNRTLGLVDAQLLTGKHAMRLAQAPSRVID